AVAGAVGALVARDAVQGHGAASGADGEVAGHGLERRRPVARVYVDVAGDGLDLRVPADAADLDVAADPAQARVARELGDLYVARGAVDLGAAERPARVEVGRARGDLQVGAGRTGDADEHLGRAVEEEAELARRAALGDLDAELVAAGALTQLHARGL